MVDSGSVDAVVLTMVLCSVADVTKTLAEARRVLRQVVMWAYMLL